MNRGESDSRSREADEARQMDRYSAVEFSHRKHKALDRSSISPKPPLSNIDPISPPTTFNLFLLLTPSPLPPNPTLPVPSQWKTTPPPPQPRTPKIPRPSYPRSSACP